MAATCRCTKETKRREVISTCLPVGVSQRISRSSVPDCIFNRRSCVTIFGVGPAFLWAPAHTQVPVPQRQHCFKLGQEFRVKPFFNDVPLVSRAIMRGRPEAFMVDHRSRTSLDRMCLLSVNQFS